MASLNSIKFRKKVVEASGGASTRKSAFNLAEKKFEKAKSEMIAEFDNHPVTQEIKAGPNGENISNSLGGRGNLFSFIGFPEGEDPTAVVREHLEERTRLRKIPSFNERTKTFIFKVETPSLEGIEKKTPFPWEPRSWVRGIESGISGLGHYISSKIRQFNGSRSGTAIQSEKQISKIGYKAVKYMSEIIRNFRKKL